MNRIINMCLEASIAMVILLPVFFIGNHFFVRDLRRTACYCVFAFYLAAVDSVVGLPNIAYIRFDLNVNLQLFSYMFSDYGNSLLNIVLFVPLGMMLPLFCPAFQKFWKTALFGLCISLAIELLQIFTFRATDVNDLITNSAGTILGWCAARSLSSGSVIAVPSWRPREVFAVTGLSFGVMFFLHPFVSGLIWSLLV